MNCDVPDQVAKCFRRAPIEPPTMNVEDHCVWLHVLGPAPPSWNPAYSAGFNSHALGNRHVLHDGIERYAGRGSPQASFVGFDDGAQAGHRGFVSHADWMEYGCALLSEVLVFKRCRHQISPSIAWVFA